VNVNLYHTIKFRAVSWHFVSSVTVIVKKIITKLIYIKLRWRLRYKTNGHVHVTRTRLSLYYIQNIEKIWIDNYIIFGFNYIILKKIILSYQIRSESDLTFLYPDRNWIRVKIWCIWRKFLTFLLHNDQLDIIKNFQKYIIWIWSYPINTFSSSQRVNKKHQIFIHS
jgi:hypothetical protein